MRVLCLVLLQYYCCFRLGTALVISHDMLKTISGRRRLFTTYGLQNFSTVHALYVLVFLCAILGMK